MSLRPPLYSDRAEADLRAIVRYSVHLFGANQASTYLNTIQRTCEEVASGRLRTRSHTIGNKNYWKRPIGAHVIYGRFDADGRCLIVRILHSRMNAPDHL
ncbi:Plasmid stabilization system protein ParE [Fulvimarina manganoxydans]|uniref:Plasmid stabilization system protein ParE n=1 Tax=Fulvimarina manganoxydans TaxID=937218 RepID=A0A1W1YGX9_9HYPH|nr:Plasmid stabilization system protein ParE [Fulvimarina manganoxydans]